VVRAKQILHDSNKVKLFVHTLKAYKGVEVQLHSLLHSAPDAGEGSVSGLGRFTAGNKNAGPGRFGNEKNLLASEDTNPYSHE